MSGLVISILILPWAKSSSFRYVDTGQKFTFPTAFIIYLLYIISSCYCKFLLSDHELKLMRVVDKQSCEMNNTNLSKRRTRQLLTSLCYTYFTYVTERDMINVCFLSYYSVR